MPRHTTFLLLLLVFTTGCANADLTGADADVTSADADRTDANPPNGLVAPVIGAIPDQTASRGTLYSYLPSLSQGGIVNWTKSYGPDEVTVDPATGEVRWDIRANMASESFYLGVQATNAATDGTDEEVWIVHVDVPSTAYVGPAETYETLASAFNSETMAGTTFVVRDGAYGGAENGILRTSGGRLQLPTQGNPTKYTTVIAENPGQVTLESGAVIDIHGIGGADRASYMAFKGFFIKGGYVTTNGLVPSDPYCEHASCYPHHIKFSHLGVWSDGENPINAFRAEDVLIENCYVFGGGRYKIASFQARNVVMRRNVARYDRSNNEMAEPKGTYSVYTTDGADVSNNIAVDGIEAFITWGSLAGEYTCPVTSGPTKVYFNRNLQLNSELSYGNIDSQESGYTPCEAEIRDVVSWDVRPYASSYVMTRGLSYFNHVTMGDVVSDSGQFLNGWPGNYARGVVNSVLHDFSGSGMFYGINTVPIAGWTSSTNQAISQTQTTKYGATAVNVTGFSGVLNVVDSTVGAVTDHEPLYSSSNPLGGLRYLVRIEGGSSLSGIANDGGDLGANNTTYKGRSGTFYGEDGYNVETEIPSWPHPHERLIKEKMAAYTYSGTKYTGDDLARVADGEGTIIGSRGFASSGGVDLILSSARRSGTQREGARA